MSTGKEGLLKAWESDSQYRKLIALIEEPIGHLRDVKECIGDVESPMGFKHQEM